MASGKKYNLYMYDDESEVPSSKFNANAKKAASVSEITGTASGTYTTTLKIKSD